jgi:hypothetical protein
MTNAVQLEYQEMAVVAYMAHQHHSGYWLGHIHQYKTVLGPQSYYDLFRPALSLMAGIINFHSVADNSLKLRNLENLLSVLKTHLWNVIGVII